MADFRNQVVPQFHLLVHLLGKYLSILIIYLPNSFIDLKHQSKQQKKLHIIIY